MRLGKEADRHVHQRPEASLTQADPDEALVYAELRNLVRYIRKTGGRDYWKRRRGLCAESFRQYVDDPLQDESAAQY